MHLAVHIPTRTRGRRAGATSDGAAPTDAKHGDVVNGRPGQTRAPAPAQIAGEEPGRTAAPARAPAVIEPQRYERPSGVFVALVGAIVVLAGVGEAARRIREHPVVANTPPPSLVEAFGAACVLNEALGQLGSWVLGIRPRMLA